jgi:putative ABC transport system permease protein
MFTTLEAARGFLSPRYFAGSDASRPISVIRIRVEGATGPDPLSRERIRRVAELVHERTDLAVDITAGSSRRPMLVELPAGNNGRPDLLLREGWVEKGVAVQILEALDSKSLALFFLILIVCGFFIANATFASVRARRTEIGTLAALGWPRGAIFLAILGELTLIAIIAGTVGALLAAALAVALGLRLSAVTLALVGPLTLLLALIAGVVPSLRASQVGPLEAVRPAIAGRTPRTTVRTLLAMSLQNLRRIPSRTIVGASGLFVAVAALTMLLAVNMAFQGVVVGTLLGNTISFEVRGVDLLGVALAVALAGLCVADVLFLSLRERAAEFVTLRAAGWYGKHLRRLVLLEGQGIALLGSVPGAIVGILAATSIAGYDARLVVAGALAAIVGSCVTLISSVIPIALMGRLAAPNVLAEE